MIRSSGLLVRNLLTVDVREGVVGELLMDALFDEIGCRVHLAGPPVVDDRSGLLIGGVRVSWA